MNFHRFRRHQRETELDAEIRSHLDQAICKHVERGESPDEARAPCLARIRQCGLGQRDHAREVGTGFA